MDATALIIVVVVLLIILLVLVAAFIMMRSSGRKSDLPVQKNGTTKKAVRSFDVLAAIIKEKKSSAEELKSALDEIVDHHGKIKERLGTTPHPDFKRYAGLILAICRHQNTSKEHILSFDKGLSTLNPKYRRDIDDAVQKGLNSRGM